MIIFRYLSKEAAVTLFAVTCVLLLIFLSHQLVRYLHYAADGRIASWTVLQLMCLEIPHLLTLLLPLGLFLGILIAYGRLYADNEMTILSVSGVSTGQLIQMTLPVIFCITLLVASLTLYFTPIISGYRNQLLAELGEDTNLKTLLPGRFQEISGGKRIVYIEKLSSDRQHMQTIFMAEQSDTPRANGDPNWTVVSADKGYQQRDAQTGDPFIVTTNGHRYVGTPGKNDYQILHYAKYGVRIRAHVNEVVNDEDALPTLALWKMMHVKLHRLQTIAELQWRFSMPLQALLLGLLAVPLSRTQPRQGKYARLFPSLILYMIYAHLLFIARDWTVRGVVIPLVGQWWVHGLFLIVLAYLLFGKTCWDTIKKYQKRWFMHRALS